MSSTRTNLSWCGIEKVSVQQSSMRGVNEAGEVGDTLSGQSWQPRLSVVVDLMKGTNQHRGHHAVQVSSVQWVFIERPTYTRHFAWPLEIKMKKAWLAPGKQLILRGSLFCNWWIWRALYGLIWLFVHLFCLGVIWILSKDCLSRQIFIKRPNSLFAIHSRFDKLIDIVCEIQVQQGYSRLFHPLTMVPTESTCLFQSANSLAPGRKLECHQTTAAVFFFKIH